MSIVLPTTNIFGVDTTKEMSLGHQIQYDRFAVSKECLSIARIENTSTISSGIITFCTGKEQNSTNYFYWRTKKSL